MTNILKNRKGVTLVELLAVIVIMGIIAAIAVPAIGGLIENSRRNAVEGTITSIEEAARLYAVTANPSASPYNLEVLDSYVDGVSLAGITTITFTVSGNVITFSGLGSFNVVSGGTTYTVVVNAGKLGIS